MRPSSSKTSPTLYARLFRPRRRVCGVHLTPTSHKPIFTLMGEYKFTRLDELFGAVSDGTRRAILARLAESDARVTELASAFPISLNSTSKHIRILERAGLVTRSVQGRDHVLTLNAGPMAEAADWMEFYRRFWEDRLAALEDFVIKKRNTDKRRKQ
jgi:DNA-binding transcriptional ArsR family regulator